MHLTFLGGAGTVTGSKYLLESAGARVLIDCGLFQGFKQLRLRNWRPLPVDPAGIDAVILTHAHIDHSGYLPLLVRNGFEGKVYCTQGTRDLCEILLPDSGYLHERDAEFANRHGFSKHHPALPLYTMADAEAALEPLRAVPFGETIDIAQDVSIRFLMAGHILGAAIVELETGGRKIVFSGDLGRTDDPVMVDPARVERADYLLVESTYGDRFHDDDDPEDALADIINRTAGRGGTVIIPAFAVGRSQMILYHLRQLKSAGRIPDLPIYLDSPMAIDVSEIFCRALPETRLSAAEARKACSVARYVRSAEASKALDDDAMPKVIIAASGMATGGRVLHHLKHFLSDRRHAILFAGFQAGGTRGAALIGGARRVKIHGRYYDVEAEIDSLPMLSAHADGDEIMGWLKGFTAPPRQTFIVHGEPAPADTLRLRIEEELGWAVSVPEHLETAELA